jgi:hypothetical protein
MATEKSAISLSDFEAAIMELDGASEFKNVMVYGDSGCGKTVLSGSLPGRVLHLAGEPGFISAARMGGKGQVRVIPDTATADAAIRWLENGNCNRYSWINVDGLSTMQTKFLLGYAAEAFDKNPAKRAHRNLPDKPDYFNAQNFIRAWVARLIDLPCNVLFTAHAMRTFSDDGELLVYPQIQGKGYEVSNFVSGLMHLVGFMRVTVPASGSKKGKEVRRIVWQRTYDEKTETTYFAKDQFNALGRFTDDLRFPEILKRINDSPDKPERPTIRRTRRTSKEK